MTPPAPFNDMRRMTMRECARVEYRGFGLGQVLTAAIAGAVAGAAVAYFTAPRSGTETRNRLRAMSDDARQAASNLPEAFQKAAAAAREAFNEALVEGGA
jgi:hypothetical protein